jgi:hypothetical protein
MRFAAIFFSFYLLFNSVKTSATWKKEGADTLLKIDTIRRRPYKRKYPPVKEFSQLEKLHKETDDDCVFTDMYSLQQRLKKYPFSKVVKIMAVSYYAPDPHEYYKGNREFHTGLHVGNSKLDSSTLIEIKILTKKQINDLTTLIYNYDYRKPYFNLSLGYKCFEPRNALIFIDKSGKVFDYIEICFGCMNYQSQSDKISVGTACSQKFELLKKFFIDLGINYGTRNTEGNLVKSADSIR